MMFGRYVALFAFLAVVASDGLAQQASGPGRIRLLPGYNHTTWMGIDARFGRISKEGGPKIFYEVSGFRADFTAYLERLSVIETREQRINDRTFQVALIEGDRMVVVFEDANFEARNVRTQADVVDVLLMLMTYSSERWTPGR